MVGLAGCGGMAPEDRAAAGGREAQPLRGEAGATRWVVHPRSEVFGQARAVVHDRDGDVLALVNFAGSIDFGTGPLGSGDAFDQNLALVRYSPEGRLRRVRVFETEADSGTSATLAAKLAVDRDRNIILFGRLAGGTTDFGGGPHRPGLFVVKLDRNGRFLWSKRFGGAPFVEDFDVATDSDDHLILAGSFVGTIDFGTGPLTSPEEFPGEPGHSAFVVKLTPGGRLEWVHANTEHPSQARAVTVDSQDHIIVAGLVSLDERLLRTLTVQRFSPEGDELWSRSVEGLRGFADDVATHGNRIVVVGGITGGSFPFGGREVSSVDEAGFVLAFTRGGEERWARLLGASARTVSMDPRDGVVIAGRYEDGDDLGLGAVVGVPGSAFNLFAVKLDRIDGAARWVRAIPVQSSTAWDVSTNRNGESVVAGDFFTPIDFGTGTLTPEGPPDAFLWRLAP
jgi:hypothetical protein